ncbi:unnamed protein product [Candida verbasci]|uniref:DASH complex subunit DUO1 n=1 Tax=Candida verbasci TaxID=1227364 RepID=A0A9W4XBL3_9ASCO|nr:unnamed protein product [Candida verbasci]
MSVSPNSRDSALQKEYESLKEINLTLSGLLSTIRKVENDIDLFNSSTNNTIILMNKWQKILNDSNITKEMLNDKSYVPGEDDERDDDEENELRKLESKLSSINDENQKLNHQLQEQISRKEISINRARERKRRLGL